MSGKIILLLGAARSGKSAYAEKLAAAYQRVIYVATAEAGDGEMAARIARHRNERPSHWQTVEATENVGQAVGAAGGAPNCILVDCLTMLASNRLLALGDEVGEADITAALYAEWSAMQVECEAGTADWILVSNEVGMGLVPPYKLGRLYRDALGRLNQKIAAEADAVYFLVAGLPLQLK